MVNLNGEIKDVDELDEGRMEEVNEIWRVFYFKKEEYKDRKWKYI